MKFFLFALILLSLSSSSFAERIPIAVLDLDAKGEGLDKGVADALTESVRYQFSKQESLDLVAREKMLDLAREKAIQLTGCTDVSCAVQIGKALNVRKMITGSVTKLGGNFSLFLRVVDVEKENVECSEKEDAGSDPGRLDKYVPAVVDRVVACASIQRLRTLVNEKSQDAKVRWDLCLALARVGKYPESEAAFGEAIRLTPDFPQGRFDYWWDLGNKGKNSEVERMCREFLKLKPDDAYAHFHLGRALWNQKKVASGEAERECREALRLKPDLAEAYNVLGALLREQGKLADAEMAFREAIRSKPEFWMPRMNLGNMYTEQKKYSDAEKEFREVVRLNGDYYFGHSGLGIALLRQEKNVDAEREFREALRIDPNSPSSFLNMGFVLDAQKKRAEARVYWEKAQAVETRPEWIDKIKKRLAEKDKGE